MNTLREYVMVDPWPSSRSPDATSISRSRSCPLAAIRPSASSTDRALPASARDRARRVSARGGRDEGSDRVRWGVASAIASEPTTLSAMRVTALAGGIGAGKFLRGLVRVIQPEDVTVLVNTGDDIEMHGLHVSPDLDSVTYWLAGAMDRERGWGRRDETFRATGELGRFDPSQAWFNLGDLDLSTHLYRTNLLRAGATLSDASALIARRFGVGSRIMPMSDDPVATRVTVVAGGWQRNPRRPEYCVRCNAAAGCRSRRYNADGTARGSPGGRPALPARP